MEDSDCEHFFTMPCVWIPKEYISPEMKFFPLAVPAIIVRSSANTSPHHFNVINIPNNYGYYADPEYQEYSAKFISTLLMKFKDKKIYWNPGKRKNQYFKSERGYFVDEKLIIDNNIYPPYIDDGLSGINDFIEYNANRIYEGTMNLNRFLQNLIGVMGQPHWQNEGVS